MSDQNGLTVADIEQIETWAAEVTKPSSREAINYCPNLNPQTILALCAAARRGIVRDKDAERYRWLRWSPDARVSVDSTVLREDVLDEQVDAALSAAQSGETN